MPDTYKIGGHEIRLVAPRSYTVRTEFVALAAANPVRAAAGALGVCWQGPAKPKLMLAQCGYSPAVYGGKVLDWLISNDVGIGEILEVGNEALKVLREGLVTGAEVAAAADFSDPQPGSEPG